MSTPPPGNKTVLDFGAPRVVTTSPVDIVFNDDAIPTAGVGAGDQSSVGTPNVRPNRFLSPKGIAAPTATNGTKVEKESLKVGPAGGIAPPTGPFVETVRWTQYVLPSIPVNIPSWGNEARVRLAGGYQSVPGGTVILEFRGLHTPPPGGSTVLEFGASGFGRVLGATVGDSSQYGTPSITVQTRITPQGLNAGGLGNPQVQYGFKTIFASGFGIAEPVNQVSVGATVTKAAKQIAPSGFTQAAYGTHAVSYGSRTLSSLTAGNQGGVGTPRVYTPELGEVRAYEGQALDGAGTRELKDGRLDPLLNGLQNPFSLGLAFLANSLGTWPTTYTLTAGYRHYYGGTQGVGLKTAEPSVLVLPTSQMVSVFGGGEGQVRVWSGTAGEIGHHAGETLATTLGAAFEGVGHSLSAGEAFAVVVATDRRVATGLSAGEAFSLELATTAVQTSLGVGEWVSLTLDVYDLVGATQSTGETVTTTLATTSTLPATASTGETATVTMTWHAASLLSTAWGLGEQVTAALATTTTLRSVASTGETLALSIELPPRPGIIQDLAVGQSVALELSTTFSLGTVAFHVGSSLSVGEVDELPPYRFATGQSLSAELVTTFALPVTFYHGESAHQALDIRPPAFMAAAFATGDAITYLSMKVQYSTSIHCVMYDGVFVTATEQTSTTTYDLADPYLYVDTLDWLTERNDFEFVGMGPSFQYNTGPGILVTVDLQCRPAFSIGFATGQSWVLESNERLASVNLTAPTGAVYPSEFFYIEPTINLCYPNVFPDADAMEVELDFTDNSCYSDFMFTGQTMAVALSARHQMTSNPSTGETFAFDLLLNKPWQVILWVGQSMTTFLSTDASLSPRLSTGESVKMTMVEPDAEFHHGESLSATLLTTFEVEFLERGCLDNEYRYVKEDGFEDVAKFNPVSVELEPFAHDIKARCF